VRERELRALVRDELRGLELPPERRMEIEEELSQQLEAAEAEALAEGLSAGEARRRALGQVTSWEGLRRELRAAEAPVAAAVPALDALLSEPAPGGVRARWFGGVHADLRLALRSLRRSPGFALAAALTLGLGMGVNTALFSVVHSILLRPLPLPDLDRLVGVYNVEKGFVSHTPIAYPDFVDLRERRRAFADLASYAARPFALEAEGESQIVVGELVSRNYFEVLGVAPALGRGFAADEGEDPGRSAVVVLSHGAWRRRFAGAADALGRELRLNGQRFTVIGVAPENLRGLVRGLTPEVWVPTGALGLFGEGGLIRRDRLLNRGSRWTWAIGRLAPGASLEQARQEAARVGEQLAREHPDTNRTRVIDVLPTADVRVLPGVDEVLFAASGGLLAVSGLVVLIACANATGLLLARSVARRREIAVRLSLGAPRWRVLRLLLVEGLVLAVAGAGVGVALAGLSNTALTALRLPLPVNLDLGLSLDWAVIAWAGGLSILATLGFALLPALRATREDPLPALKEGAASLATRNRLAAGLVVAQVASSLVLLTVAALLLRSLLGAQAIDPGFDRAHVALLETDPSLRGDGRAAVESLYARLAERVQAIPGVEAVAYSAHVPLSFELRTTSWAVAGREPADLAAWPEIDTTNVSPGYFDVLRIAVLRGRDFVPADREGAPRVAIVNEAFARVLAPSGEALGSSLSVGRAGDPVTVVGVVRDARYRTLGEEPRPYLYLPLAQSGDDAWTLLARTPDPAGTLPSLRAALREVDDRVPVRGVRTLEDATSASLLLPRAGATLFGLFGALGLALAATGVYGIVAQLAAQRTREVGIRMALGADASSVFRLVALHGLRLAAAGVALGAVGAALVTPLLRVALYGVGPRDPSTFILVAVVLLAVGFAASALPAARSARIDPQRVLRQE
jgi:predicted permease